MLTKEYIVEKGYKEYPPTQFDRGVDKCYQKRFDNEVDFLAERWIVFDELPSWQKYGCGLFHETYAKEGRDPKKEEKTVVQRKRISVNEFLPTGNEYREYINAFVKC